ncbi:Bromodomain and phd finger-containing protein 3 [Favolaschia claudopus]|uniref:Bromodomain and phd finger-containing protein 3 n=1 Tax=Favolaschia claudopus TaxID=2862362 RepID=A0AAW0C180_9AGAR
MGRGGHAEVVATAPALPQVSFQKIDNDESTQPSGVSDASARPYGYNDFSDFNRPDQYIRHIEPLEIDLERQVEYDMDEQDQEWLDAVNADRKHQQLDKISYEIFEVVMDRLEKDWFHLSKHIQKPDLALPSEDSTCAICDDSEGENSNAIVFCDGCNLAVHQDCYGIPYIPEGQWLCRKCTVSPENPVSCVLCPNEGGAFKQTDGAEWVHLLCAIWVSETRVSNDVFMEPIVGVESIPPTRWKLRCALCKVKEGACIQCVNKGCYTPFHVTCARKDKLLLPMKSAQGVEPGALSAFCDKHLPQEQKDIREAALNAEPEQEDEDQYESAHSKSARAYNKTYKPGPPLVPKIMLERILQYISKANIRKKPEFVALMCRYWSLKREARRGAPLLKRLHLEPWTASTVSHTHGEEEKHMKLEQLQHLRKDLEQLRELAHLTYKRENLKSKQAIIINNVITQAFVPHQQAFREVMRHIDQKDQSGHFKNPVNKRDVPDYFDVVKKPMSWSQIEAKVEGFQYWDVQAFKDDIQLVLDNAMLYNRQGTPFYKTAERIQKSLHSHLEKLNQLPSVPNTTPSADGSLPPIGDLEPPLEILDLLLSTEAIQDDTELILSADPITSLFNFEFEKLKPPPPDPEQVKAETRRIAKERDRAKQKEKREMMKEKKLMEKEKRVLDLEKRRIQRQEQKAQAAAERDASTAETLSSYSVTESASAPTDDYEISVPRTRGAVAAAAASEANASQAGPSASVSVQSRGRRTRRTTSDPPLSTRASPKASSSAPVTQTSEPLRSPASIPAPGEIPLVEHVDERGSFTMFEQGWILPVGQKRGGRSSVERPAAPPPRKRIRLDRGTSRLSVFSTPASENQTLQTGSPRPDEPRRASMSSSLNHADNSMDVDGVEPPPSRGTRANANISSGSGPSRLRPPSRIGPEQIEIPPPNIIHTSDGRVIVEELDSPSIRKMKRLRAREEMQMLEMLAANAAATVEPVASTSQIEAQDVEPLSPMSASPEPEDDSHFPPSLQPADIASAASADVDADGDVEMNESDAEGDRASELSVLSDVEQEPADLVVEPIQSAPDHEMDEQAVAETPSQTNPSQTSAKGKQPERSNGGSGSASQYRTERDRQKDLGKMVLPPGFKKLEPGTLVWAKAASFPWWPAIVYDDKDLDIPPNVLAETLQQRKKGKGKGFLYIVRFFDEGKARWQYLPMEKMRQLGEIKELDQDMLAKNSVRQGKGWGKRSAHAECQRAYRYAFS